MTNTLDSRPDLAARFALEAAPVLDALSRRAHRLASNHANAEELLQDAMLHAYSGFRTFEPGTDFRAWMFRILHNRWCSTYRSRQRRPDEVLTEYTDWESSYAPKAKRSAEEEALAAFTHSEAHRAMGALPNGIRDALFLTIVAGFSYAETAALMDIPLGTVTSRVARGRKRLRIALAHAVPVEAAPA
jgi:RNA polymerase sigma factor (sigma-70 family)